MKKKKKKKKKKMKTRKYYENKIALVSRANDMSEPCRAILSPPPTPPPHRLLINITFQINYAFNCLIMTFHRSDIESNER